MLGSNARNPLFSLDRRPNLDYGRGGRACWDVTQVPWLPDSAAWLKACTCVDYPGSVYGGVSLLLGQNVALAQSGQLKGTVSDSTGGVVPGAQVGLEYVATGLPFPLLLLLLSLTIF